MIMNVGEIAEGIPGEDWSLDDLARFCGLALRRSAEDIWKIGRALAIAREKHKAGDGWLRWLAGNIAMSRSSAYRHIEVAEKFSLEQVRALTLRQIRRLLDEARRDHPGEEEAVTALGSGDRAVLPLGDRQDEGGGDHPSPMTKRRHFQNVPSGTAGEGKRQGHQADEGGRGDARDDGGHPAWAVGDEGVEYEEVINDLAGLRRSLATALEIIRFQPPGRSHGEKLRKDMQEVSVLMRRLARCVSSRREEVA